MIRGIDNQIAVQRAVDMTRDASAQLRQADLTHDFQARINRAMEQRDQQKVLNKSQQKGELRVKPQQRDGSNNPAHDEQRDQKKAPKSEYDDLLNGAVAPDPHRHHLDIEI